MEKVAYSSPKSRSIAVSTDMYDFDGAYCDGAESDEVVFNT